MLPNTLLIELGRVKRQLSGPVGNKTDPVNKNSDNWTTIKGYDKVFFGNLPLHLL